MRTRAMALLLDILLRLFGCFRSNGEAPQQEQLGTSDHILRP